MPAREWWGVPAALLVWLASLVHRDQAEAARALEARGCRYVYEHRVTITDAYGVPSGSLKRTVLRCRDGEEIEE